jgi:hypothetical protein
VRYSLAGAIHFALSARAGHASPAAALRYQHLAEDRDAVIADALSGLAESARTASRSDLLAGYSRDDEEGAPSRHARHNPPGLHF